MVSFFRYVLRTLHQTAQGLVVVFYEIALKVPNATHVVSLMCAPKVVVFCHARPMTTRLAAEDGVGASSSSSSSSSEGGEGEGVQGAGDAYYTLLIPVSVSAKLWSTISALPSVVAAGVEEWQTLRIKQGERAADLGSATDQSRTVRVIVYYI